MNDDSIKSVAEVVWPWRRSDEQARAEASAARRKSVSKELVTMFCVATAFLALSELFEKFGWMRIPAVYVIPTFAALIFVSGMWVPPLYRGIKLAFDRLGLIMGTAMAWLILVPFYYFCFPLGRFVRFLKGKDVLGRKIERGKSTYWEDWEKRLDADQYKRQF